MKPVRAKSVRPVVVVAAAVIAVVVVAAAGVTVAAMADAANIGAADRAWSFFQPPE